MDQLVTSFSKTIKKTTIDKEIRFFIILLQFPLLMEPTHHEILSKITEGILLLSSTSRDNLRIMLQEVPKDIFSRFISLFQQFITVQLYARGYIDEKIAYATRIIGLLNAANEGKVLHKQRVHYDEFYNDAVNNIVDLKEDYKRWIRALDDNANPDLFANFSFCQYPFILDPQSKSQILQYDAEAQQQKELRTALVSSFFTQSRPAFYLILNIHRERLLQSALNQLTVKSHELKKPLKVVFAGEEGIDEGGVQKEFFQLVVKQLFDVQYGMFEYNEETRTFWFNPNSFENEDNFKLTGIILGLAIYNNNIVEAQFPLVVYKKLLGMTPTFEDLKDMDPDLGRGLQQLLDFDGDVEEVFCRSFEVETEVFGHVVKHELKPNGSEIPVTNSNRQEYVDLYVKWRFIYSIQKQFDAFLNGFKMVVNNQDILHLFRPEELELMICGSPDLDFDALERNTKYADGFTKEDPLIVSFWKIVKDFTDENKKKFLAFCTGSDRVPIKGLGNMAFVIVKNGDDSDRLPTAHTCFNYLLIPRYKSEEKLKDRLLTAIQNAEGFGLQ
jgi:ubiquitin-protein ligase E3 A